MLRHEWVNARGAIARFDRMALEIRIVDVQECPAADIAVVEAITAAVRWQVEGAWCDPKRQRAWDHRALASILKEAVQAGDLGIIDDRRFLQCFGYPEAGRARFAEVWQHITETALPRSERSAASRKALQTILEHGCLARRIACAAAEDSMQGVYARLASCLATGTSFEPAH